MSSDLQRSAVMKHFQDLWTSLSPTFFATVPPISFPNQKFITPSNSMFAVVNIVSRGTFRKSLGFSGHKRHESTLQIDVYTPADKGTSLSRRIADALEKEYQDLVLPLPDGETLMFGTPSSRTLALNEQRASNLEDNWDRYVTEAPFYRDHFL